MFLFAGLNPKQPVAILNCLLARQLCFEDASCSAILEIIPRVCGAEQGIDLSLSLCLSLIFILLPKQVYV